MQILGEEVLTMEEMKALFQCGDDKIRRMVKQHKLPTPISHGRRHVWFRSSVVKTMRMLKEAAENNVRRTAF